MNEWVALVHLTPPPPPRRRCGLPLFAGRPERQRAAGRNAGLVFNSWALAAQSTYVSASHRGAARRRRGPSYSAAFYTERILQITWPSQLESKTTVFKLSTNETLVHHLKIHVIFKQYALFTRERFLVLVPLHQVRRTASPLTRLKNVTQLHMNARVRGLRSSQWWIRFGGHPNLHCVWRTCFALNGEIFGVWSAMWDMWHWVSLTLHEAAWEAVSLSCHA